jgi:hypothetical protein
MTGDFFADWRRNRDSRETAMWHSALGHGRSEGHEIMQRFALLIALVLMLMALMASPALASVVHIH